MSATETYKQKFGFSGTDAVLGIEYLVKGVARFGQLTEEEQQAFFADVLGGVVKVGVVNSALAKVDLPGIPPSMEPVFKEALLVGLREELAKQLAGVV